MNRMLLAALTFALVPVLALSATAASPDHGRNPLETPAEQQMERFRVDGSATLDAIAEAGFDVTHEIDRVPTGFEAEIIVDAAGRRTLIEEFGAVPVAEGREFNWDHESAVMQEQAADFTTVSSDLRPSWMVIDEVSIGRVDYFTTKGQGFISVEAKSTFENGSPALLLSWDGAGGAPAGAQVMTAFVDSGEYMYHRVVTTVEARPQNVTIVSALGGTATAPVEEWLYDVESPLDSPEYESGFVDSYKDPTELFDRIDALHAAHPDVTEIVHLGPTNGYQRKAQATIGSSIVVNSVAWGHEGGNDITITISNTGADPIAVSVDGSAITVGTNATSSAQDVIDALNEQAGDLVYAHGYRTSSTSGTAPTASAVSLSDFLSAPIERGPFDVRALRIGKHRDGTKPGVLIIAQDHAREWVPPLIALEATERLLANYETDPASADIIENVDIFVIPSNNPDGSHYSMYDYASQRKNMTNHCDDRLADPGYRDQWGVDLNRNYSVASIHDGFAGASLTCTSSTFAGYEELSEPEARNVVNLVEANDNIKFFMTIHSNGGQLFWQPGAYIAQGRQTPTRPPLGDETYYWQMAERILSHVKTFQDTVVRPDMVGGSSDVLYSSAGNVREELYVNYGVYAFGWEVGGAVWNPTTRQWSSGSFQPSWTQAQGEYMEYASGVTEMFRIAADYGRDDVTPSATLDLGDDDTYGFETSEPAHVHYTTDGSTPTAESTTYMASGIRERGQRLTFSDGTTVRWIAVDPAGNTSPVGELTIR